MPRRLPSAFMRAAPFAVGLLIPWSGASAQQRTIRVMGDDGQPVAYANVTLAGERPRITNEKGDVTSEHQSAEIGGWATKSGRPGQGPPGRDESADLVVHPRISPRRYCPIELRMIDWSTNYPRRRSRKSRDFWAWSGGLVWTDWWHSARCANTRRRRCFRRILVA